MSVLFRRNERGGEQRDLSHPREDYFNRESRDRVRLLSATVHRPAEDSDPLAGNLPLSVRRDPQSLLNSPGTEHNTARASELHFHPTAQAQANSGLATAEVLPPSPGIRDAKGTLQRCAEIPRN